MLSFGVFGTGHWAAETHAAALAAHPRARLAGVWGRNPDKARALADRYGVPAFDSTDALTEAVDAVAFAVPPDVQAELAVGVASAGRHLLLDKPVALSVAAADRLVSAADQAGVASVVFFTNRFIENIASHLATVAATGDWHGASVTMHASIYEPGNPYGDSRWRHEHGALWDIGPHALSLLVPVLGRVTRVAAMDGPRGMVDLLLTHDSGATSNLSLTLDAPPAAKARAVRFYGESGVDEVPDGTGSAVDALGRAIDQLVEQVESGVREHACDVRFARDVVAVLAAADAARAEGRTVPL
ncbi:Gfo/Idh/MocA family protein [Plantactinospora siamensis]|uniref:Gfo/Idh/MocA family protein n=1 Tax=Plantactinospora siamensis TaxID=555372 RepID=A0ABV6NZK2_9ACTN